MIRIAKRPDLIMIEEAIALIKMSVGPRRGVLTETMGVPKYGNTRLYYYGLQSQ